MLILIPYPYLFDEGPRDLDSYLVRLPLPSE